MFKRNIIYTALLALFITMWGCDKLIFDDNPTTDNSPTVHISVNLRAVEQGDTRSINYDGNYEDAVHTLAMIIFESGEENIHSSYFNNNIGSDPTAIHAFSVELKAGKKYDFYFVANRADLETKVGASIKTRNEVMGYLNGLNNLDMQLYKGALAKGEDFAFPMARVYLNQVVPTGGSVYQPKPFYPKQHANDNLVPNVIVNVDGNGEEVRDYVELVRVVAKLEVNIQNTLELEAVERIYYKNAFGQFSLTSHLQDSPKYKDKEGESTNLFSKEDGKYWFYMPEALMNDATWGTSDHKPINYFVIKMKDGTEHEIPIITANDYKFTDEDKYMDYATNGTNPEKYNIFRNHKYVYTVKNLIEDIEINYEVNPWNKVTKTLYMGYGYNVEIDENGKVTITNTIDDCIPHKVKLVIAGDNAYFDTENGQKNEIEYGYTTIDEIKTGANKKGYSENFTLVNNSTSDAQLKISYNGILVKTLTIKPTTTE